jgi:hypothetical protein
MPGFHAPTVLAGFKIAEEMMQDTLRIVPYCPEHENVWSPRLVTILIEVGSQLDSLWKSQYPITGQQDITDHFQTFGKDVAGAWVVFWGEEGTRLHPFAEWDGLPGYTAADYRTIGWWKTHTEVKHERLANRKLATMKTAALALVGLFVAIVRCLDCADAIAQEKWIPASGYGVTPAELLGPDSPILGIVAESKLISFATGIGRGKGSSVSVKHSYKFQKWCIDNRVRHT